MKIPPRLADQLNANQRRQDQIIKQRQEPRSLSASSLGDRSRTTGLYDIPDPRGGDPKPGVKINNAAIDPADTYRITDDGVRLVADSNNAIEKITPKQPDSLEARSTPRNRCNGYLRNGQVFNCPEEEFVPRGLIILTHTLYQLSTATEENPLSLEDANVFADTLFKFFSGGAGAIVYTPYNIDDDPYLSINHTWLNPDDFPTLQDIPGGAIIHYPAINTVDPETRDFLIDYAKNSGAVIYALTVNETGSTENANTALSNLGFGASIEARPSLDASPSNACIYNMGETATNITIGNYSGVFNFWVLSWQANFWAAENPIWERYAGRFEADAATGYQQGMINEFVTTNGIDFIQQPPLIQSGAFPSENILGMQFALYPIDEALQYYPLTYVTGSRRTSGDGVSCDPSYLSGIYFTPEQLP